MRMPDRDSPESRKKELPFVELADDGTEDGTDHHAPQGEDGDRTEPFFHQVFHTSHSLPGGHAPGSALGASVRA